MLGKGLESLIPQKGSSANGTPAPSDSGAISAGNAVQPAPVNVPSENAAVPAVSTAEPILADLPSRGIEQEFPPRHDEALREIGPATPTELDMPHSNEQIVPTTPQIFSTPSAQIQNRPTQGPVSTPSKQKKGELMPQDYVFHIEVEKIHPNPSQPRRGFNEDAIREMANSVREFGFLQPLVVSKIERETPTGVGVEYQLIAGERRLRAAKLLGLRVVPVIIRNVDLEREKLELAVIENLQREDLNPVEMARAFQRLQEEFRMTQREIAAKLGKSRETVANTVRLLDLPEYIQDALQKGSLSESHARLLLAVQNPAAQKQLFDDIAEHGLTVRDAKERVQRFGGGGTGHRGRPSLAEMEANLPPEMRALQDELSSSLGAPVQIQKGAGSGKIMISFYSQEELENILRRLGKEEG
jgi:ParB family chromosome partitioning protein